MEITPKKFCERYGLIINDAGFILYKNFSIDLGHSDVIPYVDLYMNDIWNIHLMQDKNYEAFAYSSVSLYFGNKRTMKPHVLCMEGI